MSSVLVALNRTSTGEIVAVYLDYVLKGAIATASGFVSVVSSDRSRACPDLELALSPDARPIIAFVGDTLLSLEQRVVAERAVSVIRRYAIDTRECQWLAVH